MNLTAKLKIGDQDAYRQLITEKKRMLYSIAFNILLNKEDALDAIQDTFVRFYTYRKRLKQDEKPDAYLIRILKNCCFDILKKNRKHASEELTNEHHKKETTNTSSLEIREGLDYAMRKLGKQERLIVSLIHSEGYSSSEAADILNLKSSTVRTHYMNARKKLKDILMKRFPEFAR